MPGPRLRAQADAAVRVRDPRDLRARAHGGAARDPREYTLVLGEGLGH